MDRHQICFLQTNINHSAAAQDLLAQSMAEWCIDIGVICEPYFVPNHSRWIGDLDNSVAIITGSSTGSSLSPLETGSGYVVAGWRQYVIVGIYFSPNRSLAEFEIFLDSIKAAIFRQSLNKILVLGDFNAKSRAWGNVTSDSKGKAVQVWALLSGLFLLNMGSEHTCVRHNGGSVVDLSFASPSIACNVSSWRVEKEVETLSDHLYIRFEVSTQAVSMVRPRGLSRRFPRWALGQLNINLAKEAAIVANWSFQGSVIGPSSNIEELAGRMRDQLTKLCDAAMPRARRRLRCRQVFWWTTKIAEMRVSCNRARRAYTRCRRRNGFDSALEDQLRIAYKAEKKALQLAIRLAKDQSRQELLATLNRDPWGRPYLGARNKLRVQSAPLTETLPMDFLLRLVVELFPEPPRYIPPSMAPSSAHEELSVVPPITQGEMDMALRRLRSKKRAPGPDGIPGRVLSIALEYLSDKLRELFDLCLSAGQFPKTWKEGGLCLLLKKGRPLDSSSAYRPIVLLNETGKLFEKIIVSRLIRHLEEVGPGL